MLYASFSVYNILGIQLFAAKIADGISDITPRLLLWGLRVLASIAVCPRDPCNTLTEADWAPSLTLQRL